MNFNQNQFDAVSPSKAVIIRNRRFRIACFFGIILLIIVLCARATYATIAPYEPVDLTILADDHMRLPLSLIARDYSAQGKGSVTLWFADAKKMREAVGAGADADMVITSDASALSQLEQSGQIDVYATQTIATTPLVIAVTEGNYRSSAHDAISLLGWRYNDKKTREILIIDNGDMLQSSMAKRAFSSSDLLKNDMVTPLPVATIEYAITLMQQHQTPALLLAVDAFSDPRIRVVQRFPTSIVAPARFKAAVLAGEHMDVSRAFMAFLQSDAAQTHMKSFGLSATPPQMKAR